jgi:hypothetical protein
MKHPFSILNVIGPFREPREPAFSYDYSVHRPTWPTPQAVRVKVSIGDELGYLKDKVLMMSGGSPGQQVKVNQILTRWIADRKLQIANDEGMFLQRLDIMIDPFTGPLAHLFSGLTQMMEQEKAALREEIRQKANI